MKADPFQIGEVLKDPKRFVVPIYQRTYAWKVKPHLETFFAQVEAKTEERLSGNAKREKFRTSLVKLNHKIAEFPDWTAESIRARAAWLSQIPAKVWPGVT